MPKKHNKDYIEKLINHTMRHGRKAAAIGLVSKSLFLLGHKLLIQGAASHSVALKRVRNRPQLLCAVADVTSPINRRLVTNRQLPFVLDAAKKLQGCSAPAISYVQLRRESIDLYNVRRESIDRSKTTAQQLSLPFNQSSIGNTFSANASITNLRLVKKVSTKGSSSQKDDITNKGAAWWLLNPEAASTHKTHNMSFAGRVKDFVRDGISQVRPSLETRKKKIAGITRHVPSVVSPLRGEGLAIRWLVAAAKEKQRRTGKGLAESLSDELLDAYLKRGETRGKRDSLHKLAESNRSYIRYRWW